VIKIKLQTS